MKRFFLSMFMASLLSPLAFGQITVFSENFESYANQAAFRAKWMETNGSGTGPAPNPADVDAGYLIGCPTCSPITNPANYSGIQGQAADHIGSASGNMVNQYDDDGNLATLPFNIAPSATQKILFKADVFVGTSGNERMTVGLRGRDPSTANLIELGAYNANTCDPTAVGCNPEGVSDPSMPSFIVGTGYAAQLRQFNGIGGPLLVEPNWQYFQLPQELDRATDADEIVSIADIGAGWHRYTAEITETQVTLTIDLFRDGLRNDTRGVNGAIVIGSGTPGPDATLTFNVLSNLAVGYDSIRIGGPSGVTSAGVGFMAFDNILVQLVPIVAPGPLGDFNEDDVVDAADYVTWRRNAVANAPLPNDNGAADQVARYDVWRAHFGDTASGASRLGAVPEAASIALVLLGLAPLALGRRGR